MLKPMSTHHAKYKWFALVVGGMLLVVFATGAGWLAWQRTRPQPVSQAQLDSETATPADATKDRDLQKDLQDINRNIEGYDSDEKSFTDSLKEQEPQINE